MLIWCIFLKTTLVKGGVVQFPSYYAYTHLHSAMYIVLSFGIGWFRRQIIIFLRLVLKCYSNDDDGQWVNHIHFEFLNFPTDLSAQILFLTKLKRRI